MNIKSRLNTLEKSIKPLDYSYMTDEELNRAINKYLKMEYGPAFKPIEEWTTEEIKKSLEELKYY